MTSDLKKHVEKYPDDCARIQKVARKLGRNISLEQAAELWLKHSDDFAAGWLIVDSDEEILLALDSYWNEVKAMSEHMPDSEFQVGYPVRKVGGDYTFEGTVVAVFRKLSGKIRLVVEDDRGILHVYSEKNLERM